MNLRRIAARTAVAGVTTALAAGALVGATGTAANAVDDSTDYACQLTSPIPMDLGTFNLAISTPVIPATATAGQSFSGGLLALTAVLTIPSPNGAALSSYGVDHADANDYAVGLGATSIGAPISFGAPTVNEDGSATMEGGGANEPFTLPKAGTYKAQLPENFTLDTTVNVGSGPIPATIACASDAPGDLGSVQVTPGVSQFKSVKASKGKLTATVERVGDSVVPTGKVVAKVGKKSYTGKLDKKGTAVIKMPKSTKGKKATVSYKGDAYTAASDPVKVTVK